MKKIITMILIAGVLTGCEENKPAVVKMKTVCLKLYFVNGLTKRVSIRIPASSHFTVETNRGSYYLEAKDEKGWYRNYKSGVMDFDIINCN